MAGFDGVAIGYKYVKEMYGESETTNGYKLYTFDGEVDVFGNFVPMYPRPPFSYKIDKGRLQTLKTYDHNSLSLAFEEKEYRQEQTTLSPHGVIKVSSPINAGNINWVFYRPYDIVSPLATQLLKTTQEVDNVITITDFEVDGFDRILSPIKMSTTNSDDTTHHTHYEYAFNFSAPVYDSMVSRNIIATPIKTKIEVNGDTVNGTEQICDFFQSNGSSGGSASDPIYPKTFLSYEMTWDANGTAQITGDDNGWTIQGEVLEYDMTVGKPKRFKQRGWEEESYTWDASNKLITTRKYEDFEWKYRYYDNTRLLSSITDIDSQVDSFEYDQLMRLTMVFDRNGAIKTTYDYKYYGQDPLRPKNYVKTDQEFVSITAFSKLQNLIAYQYLDGLGRPIQTVQQKHSPDETDPRDIINALEYDNQGRVIRQYEPYLSVNNDGRFVNLTTIATNTEYTLTEYEDSPLNRPLRVTPPDWHPTHTLYGKNETTISPPGSPLTYTVGELYTQTVIEPDGSGTLTGDRSITFTDKRGRTVLTRRQNMAGTSINDTYTLYDNKDRVHKILPPGVSLNNAGLFYEYQYNGRDLVTSKKIPDQNMMLYLYDDRDLPVSMIDGNLQENQKRMVTKYDVYGRAVETGLTNFSTTFSVNLPTIEETWTATSYDGKTLNNSTIAGDQYMGKVRETKVALLDENTALNHFLNTQFEYDVYGRVTHQKGQNHRTSATSTLFNHNMEYDKYDFADNVVQSYFHYSYDDSNTTTNIRHLQTYDHQGRLIDKIHYFNNNQASNHICQSSYTHKDQMAAKRLGVTSTSTELQKVNYTYLENGFLEHINYDVADPTDLFKLQLNYNQSIAGFAHAQYNGNIAQLTWQVQGQPENTYGFDYDYLDRLTTANYGTYNSTSLSAGGEYNSTYSYDARGNLLTLTRDGLRPDGQMGVIDDLVYSPYSNTNRILTITDGAPPVSNSAPPILELAGPIAAGTYQATQTVKASGQITAGNTVDFQAGNLVCLEPNFSTQTNFSAITAPVSGGGTSTANGGFVQNSTDDYLYDQNGNMNRDPNKGMDIFYNYLNLPYKVVFDNGSTIEWLYDASGTKWQKTVTENAQSTPLVQQDYLGSVEYKDGTLEAVYFEDGRMILENGTPKYQYYLKDHLGNNRVVFKDDGSGVAEIVQENHYYAFGMEMKGIWSQSNNADPDNNYLYNGKELDQDFGLDWYHYGFRMYDPQIGRFTGVDPISDQFAWVSTYNYAENEPIANIDLHGLQKHRMVDGSTITGPVSPEALNQIDEEIVTEQLVSRSESTEFIPGIGNVEVVSTNPEQGQGMMDIFNPDNIGNILLLGEGTGANSVAKAFGPKFNDVVLSKGARLKIFMNKLTKADAASNPDEAIGLINKTLDNVEDLYSGVKKSKDAANSPNRNDGRMYGILDEKFVTRLDDGTRIAKTKGQRIVLNPKGGFKIQSRDGKKTFFSKAGKQ